jgi:hypothetical protein
MATQTQTEVELLDRIYALRGALEHIQSLTRYGTKMRNPLAYVNAIDQVVSIELKQDNAKRSKGFEKALKIYHGG